jgi:rhodanese-related sulfurtransferase
LDRIFSLDRSQLFIIDVRTKDEYDAGHFSAAVNIPSDEIEDRIGEIERHKDMGIILYCHSGSNAATAEKLLKRNGFEKVINVGAYKGIKKYDA